VCPVRTHPPRRLRGGGGAVKRESSAEGGASEPPRPSQDAQEEIVISDDDLEQEEKPAPQLSVPDEAPSIKSEGPLSTVKGEVAPPDASASGRPKTEPSPTEVALPPSRESSLGTPPSPAPNGCRPDFGEVTRRTS
jgi:hypothetical protein